MHTVTTNGKDNFKESKESIWGFREKKGKRKMMSFIIILKIKE